MPGRITKSVSYLHCTQAAAGAVVAGIPATTVNTGLELLGAGAGGPRRPFLPLEDEGAPPRGPY